MNRLRILTGDPTFWERIKRYECWQGERKISVVSQIKVGGFTASLFRDEDNVTSQEHERCIDFFEAWKKQQQQ